MRLAYCTGMRRCDCSTKTTAATITQTDGDDEEEGLEALGLCDAPERASGKRAAIDVKISSDMPLPMPRSVMSSPIHMMRPVPAVMVMTMSMIAYQASSVMSCCTRRRRRCRTARRSGRR